MAQPTSKRHFLLVSAGECAPRGISRGVSAEIPNGSWQGPALLRNATSFLERMSGECSWCMFAATGISKITPWRRRSSGTVTNAMFNRLSGRSNRDLLSSQRNRPVSAGVIPKRTRANSVRPAPTIRLVAEASPARRSRLTSWTPDSSQSTPRRDRAMSAERGFRRRIECVRRLSSDHELDEGGLVHAHGVLGSDAFTISQDRYSIRRGEISSMRCEM